MMLMVRTGGCGYQNNKTMPHSLQTKQLVNRDIDSVELYKLAWCELKEIFDYKV